MFHTQNGIESAGNSARNHREQPDVLAALLAHVRWKKQLLHYIEGSAEEMEPEAVRGESGCALGQWIHGAGGVFYGDSARFEELRDLHKEIHHHAAEIVRAVLQGECDQALNQFRNGSYAKASRRINTLLARISLESEFS